MPLFRSCGFMSSAGRAEQPHAEPSAQVRRQSRGSWTGRSWWSGPWWTASPVSHSSCTRGKCSTGARGCPASSWAGARSTTADVIIRPSACAKSLTACHGIKKIMTMIIQSFCGNWEFLRSSIHTKLTGGNSGAVWFCVENKRTFQSIKRSCCVRRLHMNRNLNEC